MGGDVLPAGSTAPMEGQLGQELDVLLLQFQSVECECLHDGLGAV